jgi:hypothetical protein
LAFPGRLLLAFVATVVIQASGKPAQKETRACRRVAKEFSA